MKKMIRETKKIPSEMYDVRSTALYAALLTLLTWFTPLTWFTLLTWLTLLTCFTLLTWFALLTWLALLTGDGWIGRMGHTPETVTTVTNIAVIAHDGFWKHTPLTLFTLLILLDNLHYVLTYYPILTAWVIRSWKI